MICSPYLLQNILKSAAGIILKEHQHHEQGLHQGLDLQIQGQDQDQGLKFQGQGQNQVLDLREPDIWYIPTMNRMIKS